MKNSIITILSYILSFSAFTQSQTIDSFYATTLINTKTTSTVGKGNLGFLITHKFGGTISDGAYELWGLDAPSNIRLGLEYGLLDKFDIGIGRTKENKNLDLSCKYKVFEQIKGKAPFATSFQVIANMVTLKKEQQTLDSEIFRFGHRMSYVYQLSMSKSLSDNISILIAPTVTHKNLARDEKDHNTTTSVALGGVLEITRRMSISGEYFIRFNPNNQFKNPIGLSVDFHTFSHAFQLFFTNTTSIPESSFIPDTEGDFFGGDVHFGFNISRKFRL